MAKIINFESFKSSSNKFTNENNILLKNWVLGEPLVGFWTKTVKISLKVINH